MFRLARTAALGILCLYGAASALTPFETHGALKVVGNKIKDSKGDDVQLRGMSLFWSMHVPKYWNPLAIKWLAEDWKISVIRAAMAVENDENPTGKVGYLESPVGHEELVKTVVDAAIYNGIYVIIDWHDHNAEQHTARSKAFFSKMAEMYGEHPNVIYEIFNEPKYQSWDQIKAYSNEIVTAIRAKDPDNLILIGTPFFSANTDVAAGSPLAGTNLVYVHHFYAGEHKDTYRSKVSAAMAKGQAVFVSEFGSMAPSGDGPLNLSETATWLSFMKSNNISWCNWALSDHGQTSGTFVANAPVGGGWTAAHLTESGTWIRNQIRTANAGYTWTAPRIDTVVIPDTGSVTIESEKFTTHIGDVLVRSLAAASGGKYMGNIGQADWMEYQIKIPKAGKYVVTTRYAGGHSGDTLQTQVDAYTRTKRQLASTGGFTTWKDLVDTISFSPGPHKLRLLIQSKELADVANFDRTTIRRVVEPSVNVSDRAARVGQARLRRGTQGLELELPAEHGWKRMELIDAAGRQILGRSLSSTSRSVAIPSASSPAWIRLSGHGAPQEIPVSPAQ